jgi:hypothetical protein
MGRFEQLNPCDNLNHRRKDPPYAHCPQCGGVVNARLSAKMCTETGHAKARRDRTAYCVDCGEQLILDR